MTDYDRDPAALAWARSKVAEYLAWLAEFEAKANKDRNAVMAYSCGVARELTRQHFLGDGGSTLGVFDERQAGHDHGPSVRECAEADRAHWADKYDA